MKYLLKNHYILSPTAAPKSAFECFRGSLLVSDGKIHALYKEGQTVPAEDLKNCEIIDGHFRRLVFPGFIQSHIHFCQTLHRNRAEQMPLMQWLKQEIWPYEGNLNPDTMGRAVLMSLKEVLAGGTTSVLDMGTVHHQDVIFEIMARAGFRYTGGKAMMDKCDGAPHTLSETTAQSIDGSIKLAEKYHGAHNGLLQYAFAPRFVLSCSTDLLAEVRKLSDQHNILIHTHASEHPEEVAFIKETTGYGNIAYLDQIGALNNHSVIAHMVHLDQAEREMAKQYNLSIAHCPTTNLKLGSGVAPISRYLDEGLWVGLGADGAPCNNALSIMGEIKLAALLQKGVNNDPVLMEAEDALRLVSLNGAKILRREKQIGQIKAGMEADLVVLDMDTPQTYNFQDNPAAAIVYGADARNVYGTMVAGQFLYRDGKYSRAINQLDAQYG